MSRRFFAAITAATVLAAPGYVLAAGAPIRKPPVSVTTLSPPSAPPPPSVSSVPSEAHGITREQILGGCGRGRVRDPRTNECRGPADVSR